MVITFSRHFQKEHPNEGKNTYFVPKIMSGLLQLGLVPESYQSSYYREFEPKFHTVRRGNRFKVGDTFDPRIWKGNPYKSKQFQFAPRLTVSKVWQFDIDPLTRNYLLNGIELHYHQIKRIATNDGLEMDDFECWFPKEFRGQIICWNNKIEYP